MMTEERLKEIEAALGEKLTRAAQVPVKNKGQTERLFLAVINDIEAEIIKPLIAEIRACHAEIARLKEIAGGEQ